MPGCLIGTPEGDANPPSVSTTFWFHPILIYHPPGIHNWFHPILMTLSTSTAYWCHPILIPFIWHWPYFFRGQTTLIPSKATTSSMKYWLFAFISHQVFVTGHSMVSDVNPSQYFLGISLLNGLPPFSSHCSLVYSDANPYSERVDYSLTPTLQKAFQ